MLSSKVNRQAFHIIWHPTVKPVLSGHPLLSGQQPKSPNLFPLFTLNKTFIRRTPLLSRRGHLKSDLKWSFLLLPTCIKRTLELHYNLCSRYYDQLVHFHKGIHANVYRHSLWEYSNRFHCSFEWHLTPHMSLSIETWIRRTPCVKQTLQHSPRVSA